MSKQAASLQTSLAIVAVFVTVAAWASAFPLIHIGLRGLDPLPLAATRFWLAGAIAAAWLIWTAPPRPSWRDTGMFLLCGLVGIALYNALLNSGQRTVSAGAASFLINTSPIITALLATFFLRERFGPVAWVGSAVVFAGVAIIAAGQAGGLSLGAGASLVLLAAACQATYFILQRPLVPRYGALACAAYTILAGAFLLTPWLAPGLRAIGAPGTGGSVARAVIALAIIPSVIGYGAWTHALGVLGAARAANFLYLVPPLAVLISFILTRDVPGWPTIAGGLLAIAGVAIVNLRSRLEPQARGLDCRKEMARL